MNSTNEIIIPERPDLSWSQNCTSLQTDGKKHKSYGSTATLTDYAMLFGVLYSLISKK